MMPTTSPLGRLVATALQGSWISTPSDSSKVSESQLEEVAPLLYESGAGALGWWRIRESELRETPPAELLHQAFRLLALRAKTHEVRIEKVFRHFRIANVQTILIKGWSVARLYPQPALRPYGDIDLYVRPRDHDAALEVISKPELRDCFIDLHRGVFELEDRSTDEVFSRSGLVACGGEQVRVLAPEDHFALLAIHLLKHGAWRPLWLCDLGLLLESMAHDFDWDLCLGRDQRRRNWILSAIGLARTLLDASIKNESIDARANAPAWLVESVLKNWQQPFAGAHAPHNHRAPIKSYLHRPRGVFKDLVRRWPDPILATISVKGTFGNRPRKRYQLRNCLQRAMRLVLEGPEVR